MLTGEEACRRAAQGLRSDSGSVGTPSRRGLFSAQGEPARSGSRRIHVTQCVKNNNNKLLIYKVFLPKTVELASRPAFT